MDPTFTVSWSEGAEESSLAELEEFALFPFLAASSAALSLHCFPF
jgi:hypothetical protein